MPRKRVKQQKRVSGHVGSHEELARTLGVHRNTIGAWARNGAPAGPPYSIVEWYQWAKRRGYAVKKPREDDVRALLDDDRDVRLDPEDGATEDADGNLKLPGDPTPYDRLVIKGKINFAAAREREQLRGDILVVQQREIAVDSARIEREKQRGTLIAKDDATKAATLVFNAFVREGEQLAEAVVQALAKHPHSLRAEASAAVKAAWTAALERVGVENPDARG